MSDCKHKDCKHGRRDLLKLGGMTLVVSAIEPALLRANPRLRSFRSGILPTGKTLIHIWLRGGQDGLQVTIPTNASEYATYQSYRPTLQHSMSALTPQQLDSEIALAPACNPGLMDLYNAGQLAVLPTVGYPSSSRSHFDGQKFVENGTPWNKLTADGWLNRWLQANGPSTDALQAVSFTSSIPPLLAGSAPILSFSGIGSLEVTGRSYNTKYLASQELAYGVAPDTGDYHQQIIDSGAGLIGAIREIEARQPLPDPDPAAAYPDNTFGRQLTELAQLMKAGFQIELANVELNGWDTHSNQATPFDTKLADLSQGIAALVTDLGPTLMQDTLIMSVSEFGRTARENGNRGTDHGNAWTTFVVSPNVNNGVHLGPSGWPGLDNLRDDRDLMYTVDYRDLYSEVLQQHMGLLPPDIFPGWTHTPIGFL